MNSGFPLRRRAGFTIVELVTVIIVVGIVGAIGVGRFFDNAAFENRSYADQVKAIIRYAQKMAIAQNRMMVVRANGNSFAVCSTAACAATDLINSPAGSNTGSAATQSYCQQGGAYVARWMCEGRPTNIAVSGGTSFYFDALGRPYTIGDTGTTSTFAGTTFTFTSGTNTTSLLINRETGYVE